MKKINSKLFLIFYFRVNASNYTLNEKNYVDNQDDFQKGRQ